MRGAVAAFLLALGADAANLNLTLRTKYMSPVGRADWDTKDTVTTWDTSKTGIIVVDMWDKHWCPIMTQTVAKLAVPMQQFIDAARADGVTIIWAPSEVTDFYNNTPARNNVVSIPNRTMPLPHFKPVPTLPTSAKTDGGCEVQAKIARVWKRQIPSLNITDRDYLVSSWDLEAEQELWNLLGHTGINRIIYVGVAENMCVLNRPFAIRTLVGWGWAPDQIAVVRELTDIMYTPKDPPYVPHLEAVQLNHEYIEMFWASTMSMYDVLAPSYAKAGR
eukprot:TRINITY_DN5411_c0_g1_i1.p1 TRINITY_DN5411_c0_g1~~TRINITY_DN5411_c0_g1_i1.p1  ORF type:complete len:301 (+),score=86.35 TRINITY_DN5411_c0_g1_i1:78-905(+)